VDSKAEYSALSSTRKSRSQRKRTNYRNINLTSYFASCFHAHHYTELRPSEFYCMFYCR